MARTRRTLSEPEQAERPGDQKRYRFELTPRQLFVYGVSVVLVLSWMFVLGLLVGRGVPLVDSKEFSLQAQFLRFLGLGRHTPPAPDNVAETWENPKKMLESLTYYQDLTQKNGSQAPGEKPAAAIPKPGAAAASAPKPKAPEGPVPGSEDPKAKKSAEAPPASTAKEAAPPEGGAEHFTLLVSSLRDVENAQRLMEQLRTRGYSPRLDSLDLSESGRWNRVLLGSFRSREEAMRFAAEFNRKERMEGLIIRETD